jgi:hypothetical protein
MDFCIPPMLLCGICCAAKCMKNKNKVHHYEDEMAKKMTPEEYNIYCLHMNAYGRNIK